MSPELKELYETAIHQHTKDMLNILVEKIMMNKSMSINMREYFPNLTPSNVIDIFEEMGWDVEWGGENGWEMDTWYYLSHEAYEKPLTLSFSGYYWTMTLYIDEC